MWGQYDWPGASKHLEIIELRSLFGLGFNVWFQPVGGEYREIISTIRSSSAWTIAPQARVGDLVLFYPTAPDLYVRDIFCLAGPVKIMKAGWKSGRDYMAPIRRVCSLKAPLHLSILRANPRVKDAGFVRGSMQGRFRASDYWHELLPMIISRNPNLKRLLKDFGPDKVH